METFHNLLYNKYIVIQTFPAKYWYKQHRSALHKCVFEAHSSFSEIQNESFWLRLTNKIKRPSRPPIPTIISLFAYSNYNGSFFQKVETVVEIHINNIFNAYLRKSQRNQTRIPSRHDKVVALKLMRKWPIQVHAWRLLIIRCSWVTAS